MWTRAVGEQAATRAASVWKVHPARFPAWSETKNGIASVVERYTVRSAFFFDFFFESFFCRSAIEIQNIEDDVDVESNRVHLLVLSPEAFTLLMTENSNSRASRSSQRLAHLTSFLDDARRNLMYDDEWQLEYEYLASNKPSAELELAQWEMEVEMLRNDVAAAKQELLDELNVASDKFVKATKSNIDVDISLESVEFDFHGVKQNDGFVLGVLSMYEMVKRGFEFRFRGMGFKRETLYDN